MSDTITELNFGNKTYILVGTAHVSPESVQDVQNTIRTQSPEKVCIELDAGRYASMSQEDSWKKLDIYKVIKEGKGFLLLSNLMLSSFQKRMGLDIGIKPGEDMRAAIQTSQELSIPFSLIDRDIQVTLRRAWATSSLFGKAKLMSALLSSAFSNEKIDPKQIEELKNKSELHGMLEELSAYMPQVKKTLIDERDHYMAARLFETSEQRVLAVVGAGHVPGMTRHLEALHTGAETSDTSAISSVPKSGIALQLIGWLVPLSIVGVIVWGFISGGSEKGLNNILTWIAFNGGLAALGTLISLGHPLTILSAFIGAPIATLNPFIGIGLITGAVESMLRKPRVQDLENLQTDITSLKGFFRNRVTRILMVFILSSLGGVIGNFIAAPLLIAR